MTPLLFLALVTALVAAVRSLFSPCGLSMVSSITPFGERAKGHRYGWTAAWFVAGATAGGAILGTVCAAGAALLGRAGFGPTALLVVAAVLALVGIASDTRLFGVALPLHPRQVDETWLTRYRRWIYAAGFGLQIGSGFATYIMTGAVYLTAGLAVLTADPIAALATGTIFGLVRGLLVLIAAGATTPVRLRSLHLRLTALAPASRVLALLGQGWVVVAAVGWAGGSGRPAMIGAAAGSVCLGIVVTRAIASVGKTGQAEPTGRNGVPSREGSTTWQFQ